MGDTIIPVYPDKSVHDGWLIRFGANRVVIGLTWQFGVYMEATREWSGFGIGPWRYVIESIGGVRLW